MSRSARLYAAARRDLLAAYLFIGRDSLSAADRFYAQAAETFAALAERPGMGALYAPDNPQLDGIRFLPIFKFPSYLAFYRATERGIDVLRVVHGARDLARELDPIAGAGPEADSPD